MTTKALLSQMNQQQAERIKDLEQQVSNWKARHEETEYWMKLYRAKLGYRPVGSTDKVSERREAMIEARRVAMATGQVTKV